VTISLSNKEQASEIGNFIKIAVEILGDVNDCVVDSGMNSSEPRSLLPLVTQALSRGSQLLHGKKTDTLAHSQAQCVRLENILKELQYVEGMLKLMPKAVSPFAEPLVM
jgi:hypothetical protein